VTNYPKKCLVANDVRRYNVSALPPGRFAFMKCPNCLHDNRIEARFCEQCAAPLARTCANCGSSASSTAKFCAQCGHPLPSVGDESSRFGSPKDYTPQHLAEKILISRSALEGERKQVTVLFADIRGSMELVVDRDPEQTQALLDPVIKIMMEAVHRYEGTVNQVLGDGIMALFGAPLASEDHALRGCYAALRMQENIKNYAAQIEDRHGIPLAIRVGLNSGEIVVRIIGNDLHMEYAAVGETVHLAARMEQAANPGSIFATASTVQLIEGYINAKPLAPLPLKGLAEPVAAYEVIGAGAARTRLQAAATRGLTSFVDRELELAQLRSAQQLAETGQAQVAAIVAEPGVGKSRLLHEFLRSPQTTDWLVLQSAPPSYGRTISYLPIIDLLKQYFTIGPHDTTQAIKEKVSGKMSMLDPSLRDAVPPILDLLDSLDRDDPFRTLDSSEHRRKTYQAVIRLLLTETQRRSKPDQSRIQPIIAVFEDLHWYDTLSIGLLNELVVQVRDACLLLVVSYRPEYGDQWRNRPNYRQLRIYPLISRDLAEFLDLMLGADPGLQGLKSFLAERTSGNPFFVEEIVRTLIDTAVIEGERGNFHLARPIQGIDVPPSVQAVLAARIDRLPAAEKQLLQEAAVIGQDVPFNLLHEISGLTEERLSQLLDRLQAAEFIYTTQLFPDLQYTFKHSLICEVAYGGVLREHRRAIHARVVNTIESVYSDRLAEQVERLAYHSLRGELKEKAVHYLRQAGAKAAARGALQEARTSFEQALDSLKSLPENPQTMEEAFEARLELRAVLRQLGEIQQMLERLREAEALAERLDDDVRRGQVCSFMTVVLSNLNRLDEAITTGTRSVEIGERVGDSRLAIVSTSNLASPYYYLGEYEHVIEIAGKNLAMLPQEWGDQYLNMAIPASVFTRGFLVMSLAELGRFREAAGHEAQMLQLAAATKHAHTIGWAHLSASKLHLLRGDWAKACELLEQWVNMPATLDVAVLLPWAVASAAWTLAEIGDATGALRRVRESEEHLERQAGKGVFAHRAWSYHAVARSCLALGRLEEAQRFGHRSLESSQHQPGFAAHARRLLGDLAIHPDRFDAESAAAHYQAALELAEPRGMRPLAAYCHFGIGRLYRRSGNAEAARQHLTAAKNMFSEMDMGFWLAQVDSE
jgi:class 3 adenylate cyclase/tetratricopeptide (TPR) repeat protein